MSGVKPVNSNQPPNLLRILINADNLSFEYPNQWSMARSTGRQLLPVTNWRKWFMSEWGGGCGAEEERALTASSSTISTLMYRVIVQ